MAPRVLKAQAGHRDLKEPRARKETRVKMVPSVEPARMVIQEEKVLQDQLEMRALLDQLEDLAQVATLETKVM